MPAHLVHVLEAFQVDCEDFRQLFQAHTLCRLLLGRAGFAEILVLTAQSLGAAESTEARGQRGVLVNVHREVQKILILGADRFAVETLCFVRKGALKDFVDPGGVKFVVDGRAVAGIRHGSATRKL